MEWISEHYNLIVTDSADADIDSYIDTIIYAFDAPLTAKKHYDALYKLFGEIQKHPLAYAIRYTASLQIYGINVRRVNFKKMAIIYTVNENTVYIHRVMPGSMITGLN